MSREKQKVLEMVAEGKITPEEGVRLIEALGQADRASGRRPAMDIGDIRLPKIDLGNLGEVVVDLKKSVVEGAKKAQRSIQNTNTSKMLRFRDFPLTVPRPPNAKTCKLNLDIRAGKLKLKGQEIGDNILSGKVKRAPEEPTIITEAKDDSCEVTMNQAIGRCLMRASTTIPYHLTLENSAADSRMQLSDLEIHELEIENNAGSVLAILGDLVDEIKIGVENNAGNVRLKVPGSHAVRVEYHGTLSTENLAKLGLELIDDVATSSDWDENDKKVDILVSQNVAGFRLDWKRSDGVRVMNIDDDDEEIDEDVFE